MGLSAKQAAFIRDPSPIKVSHGSIRSSKTTAQLLDWLYWLPQTPPGPLAIVGRTRDTVGRNLLDQLAQLEPRAVQWRLGAPTATILGRTHHVLGANDSASESKVRGLTLAGAFVDEATLIPEAFFTTLLGRLSVTGARLTATTNPDSPGHWLRTKYLDRADYLGWSTYRFTMRDNPGLSAAYIERVSKEYTGLFYRRFIDGDWVASAGAIYDVWDPDRHVVPDEGLPRMVRYLAVGADYGTRNASSAILLGLGEDDVLYAIDEWRYDSRTGVAVLTEAQVARGMAEWWKGHAAAGRVPEWYAVDPAALSLRTSLHELGVARTMPAENRVLNGIRTVGALLGAGRLKVAASCSALIGEFPAYSWDEKASAVGEDKPVKVADHSLDALRYAIMSTETIWRRSVPVTAPAVD